MDYINFCITAVKAYIHSCIRGPMIEYVEGTENIARIPVWHHGRLMAVYFPVDRSKLNHGSVKYVLIDGKCIDIIPVNGVQVAFTPNMFNATTIEVLDSFTDECIYYECDDKFTI